jgi:hypothetical protein
MERRSAGASGLGRREPTDLAEVLERVLDKGVVIAGDVAINLLDIELLTIKLRLLIASADKAREMGIDWWTHDPFLSSQARELADGKGDGSAAMGDREIHQRLDRLEEILESLRSEALPGGASAHEAAPEGDDGGRG